jgi:hypothetical protein
MCNSLFIYHDSTNFKLDKEYFLSHAKKFPHNYNNYYTYYVFQNSVFIKGIKDLEKYD